MVPSRWCLMKRKTGSCAQGNFSFSDVKYRARHLYWAQVIVANIMDYQAGAANEQQKSGLKGGCFFCNKTKVLIMGAAGATSITSMSFFATTMPIK